MEAIVDVVVQLIAANPKTGAFLAFVPVVQGIGFLFAKFLPAHTVAARWGSKVAAFPIKLPPTVPTAK